MKTTKSLNADLTIPKVTKLWPITNKENNVIHRDIFPTSSLVQCLLNSELNI